MAVATAAAVRVEAVVVAVMVAVMQEAVTAVERLDEANTVVAMVAVAKVVEVAGVVQEWAAGRGGRTSPGRPSWWCGTCSSSPCRLGSSAGARPTWSWTWPCRRHPSRRVQPPKLRPCGRAPPAQQSVCGGRIKGTLLEIQSLYTKLQHGETDQEHTRRHSLRGCRTADCCWVRPRPPARATSCGASTAAGTCQARGRSPPSRCSSTRRQTPRSDGTARLLSPVARPAACACTRTGRAGTTGSSGPGARSSSSSSCLRAALRPGCRYERSTPAETRCGSTGGRCAASTRAPMHSLPTYCLLAACSLCTG